MTRLLHWLNIEFWGPVWPNLAASVITFGVGLLWARRQLLEEWERREAQHLARHEETHRLLKGLHTRLDSQQSSGKAEE